MQRNASSKNLSVEIKMMIPQCDQKQKECDMTRWKNICNKDEKILKYQIDEEKCNKEAKQKRQQDPNYHTDKGNVK